MHHWMKIELIVRGRRNVHINGCELGERIKRTWAFTLTFRKNIYKLKNVKNVWKKVISYKHVRGIKFRENFTF